MVYHLPMWRETIKSNSIMDVGERFTCEADVSIAWDDSYWEQLLYTCGWGGTLEDGDVKDDVVSMELDRYLSLGTRLGISKRL